MLVHLDAFTASTASQPTFRTGFLPLAGGCWRGPASDRAAALLDVEIAEGGSSRRPRLSYDTGCAAFEERWGDPAAASRCTPRWVRRGVGTGLARGRALPRRCGSANRGGHHGEGIGLLAQARPTFEAMGRCLTSTTWKRRSARRPPDSHAPGGHDASEVRRADPAADRRRSDRADPASAITPSSRKHTRGMSRANLYLRVAISIVMPAAASSRITSTGDEARVERARDLVEQHDVGPASRAPA